MKMIYVCFRLTDFPHRIILFK